MVTWGVCRVLLHSQALRLVIPVVYPHDLDRRLFTVAVKVIYLMSCMIGAGVPINPKTLVMTGGFSLPIRALVPQRKRGDNRKSSGGLGYVV